MQLSVYWRALANRRLFTVLVFGFASGLPLSLTGQALQAWLTLDHVSLTTIGLFTLVGQPYTYKFLWAPLMDRFEPPFLGRRRGWLLLCQLLLAVLVFMMSGVQPAAQVAWLAVLATVVAFLSASQDVVVDAYRTEVAKEDERGIAAAMGVLGYRVAMLVSGGLAFIVADQIGWPATYRLMAMALLGLALFTCVAPRLLVEAEREAASRREFIVFLLMLVVSVLSFWTCRQLLLGLPAEHQAMQALQWVLPTLAAIFFANLVGRVLQFESRRDLLGFGWMALGVELGYFIGHALVSSLPTESWGWGAKWVELLFIVVEIACAVPMALLMARLTRFSLLLLPLRTYFSREYAWPFLVFIILYKLGDAFAGTLTNTFLIKQGFSQTEIGVATKVVGFFATLVGVLWGGLLMTRLGLWWSLLCFGVLQAATNLGYWMIAVLGKGAYGTLEWGVAWMSVFFAGKTMTDTSVGIDMLLVLAVSIENLAGGMGTAALVAFLMTLCSDRRTTATQFALLSALAAIGRVYVGPSSGYLADAYGWPDFFLISIVAAIPGLLLLLALRPPVKRLEKESVPASLGDAG